MSKGPYIWNRNSVTKIKSTRPAKRNSKLSPRMRKFCFSNGDLQLMDQTGKSKIAMNAGVHITNGDRTLVERYIYNFDDEDQII